MAEVDQYKSTIKVEYICGLHVAVDEFFLMNYPESSQDLFDNGKTLLEENFRLVISRRLPEVLKGNSLSSGERLSIAEASLDADTDQSVALAAQVLETGVPGTFPSYLNELEQRDANAALQVKHLVALDVLESAHEI